MSQWAKFNVWQRLAPSSTRLKQCLKIIRIENATLWDLFNYFSDLILERDLELPVGSAVLLGSASHLANVGSAFYAEELVQVSQRLYQMFEGGISILPCPPMLIDGTSNFHLVSAIVEVSAWLKQVARGDNCLPIRTLNLVVERLMQRGSGLVEAASQRMMMPVGLTAGDRSSWDSGCTNLPAGVLPLSPKDECDIVHTLITELNNSLAMELDGKPDLAPAASSRHHGLQILVVGTSNAGRTADALSREGISVLRAVIPGWRCIKMKVPAMLNLIKSKLEEAKADCVILYQIFNNSFYLAKTAEGGLIPAVREESGGKYHVHGELTFAPKELQYSMFCDVKSIFELAGDHHKIIISPLPRYLNARCCGDADHVTNLEEDGYSWNLEESVLSCRRNLKDFAFRLGIRNLRVACPWSQLRNVTSNIWADPVHMNPDGFSLLAKLTLTTIKQSEGMDLSGNGDGSGRGGSRRGGRGGSGGSGCGRGGRGGGGTGSSSSVSGRGGGGGGIIRGSHRPSAEGEWRAPANHERSGSDSGGQYWRTYEGSRGFRRGARGSNRF